MHGSSSVTKRIHSCSSNPTLSSTRSAAQMASLEDSAFPHSTALGTSRKVAQPSDSALSAKAGRLSD